MSIATELSRIQADRNTIRAKLVALGMANNTDNLTHLATAIEALIDRGAVSVNIKEGETYTIPAGYHNGSGTVKGVAGGGNYDLQAKTVTPTKKQQAITPDSGYYGLSSVTVNAIPDAYQNVSSVTAAAGDVLTGKIFVAADGTVVTGSMTNNGAVSKTLDGTTISYTIPKGYHSGAGKVNITLETKTVTPTKAAQDITPTSGKVLSKVTVAAIPDNYIDTSDADAVAANILDDKTAYVGGSKVTGTMPNNGAISKTLDTSTTSYAVPSGYTSGGTVKLTVETKTATPTKSTQNITPSTGKVLSKVTVNPIPANYGAVDSADAAAANVLSGKVALTKDANGAAVSITGTMPNNGSASKTIDGLTTTSASIPAGYTTGGTVSLTGDIEAALAAI
ncbi:MAG: hypothetical protein J6V15_02120 [Clostridia bacterium]|nr:hypothetical protein [Clostridia bacterium]